MCFTVGFQQDFSWISRFRAFCVSGRPSGPIFCELRCHPPPPAMSPLPPSVRWPTTILQRKHSTLGYRVVRNKSPLYVSPQISLGVDDSQMATWAGHSITPPLHAKIERKKAPDLFELPPRPPADSKLGVWMCCSRPNFECPGSGGGGFFSHYPV